MIDDVRVLGGVSFNAQSKVKCDSWVRKGPFAKCVLWNGDSRKNGFNINLRNIDICGPTFGLVVEVLVANILGDIIPRRVDLKIIAWASTCRRAISAFLLHFAWKAVVIIEARVYCGYELAAFRISVVPRCVLRSWNTNISHVKRAWFTAWSKFIIVTPKVTEYLTCKALRLIRHIDWGGRAVSWNRVLDSFRNLIAELSALARRVGLVSSTDWNREELGEGARGHICRTEDSRSSAVDWRDFEVLPDEMRRNWDNVFSQESLEIRVIFLIPKDLDSADFPSWRREQDGIYFPIGFKNSNWVGEVCGRRIRKAIEKVEVSSVIDFEEICGITGEDQNSLVKFDVVSTISRRDGKGSFRCPASIKGVWGLSVAGEFCFLDCMSAVAVLIEFKSFHGVRSNLGNRHVFRVGGHCENPDSLERLSSQPDLGVGASPNSGFGVPRDEVFVVVLSGYLRNDSSRAEGDVVPGKGSLILIPVNDLFVVCPDSSQMDCVSCSSEERSSKLWGEVLN